MESEKTTDRVLKKLKLIQREGEIEEFSDDSEQHSSEDHENGVNLRDSPTRTQYSPTADDTQLPQFDDRNDVNIIEINSFAISEPNSDANKDKSVDNIALSSPFLKQKIEKSFPREPETIKQNKIKFGTNQHPYLNIWLTVLAFTGAPVYMTSSSAYFKSNKFKIIIITGVSLTLLVIYHLLFLKSALHVLETLPTNKGLYDSVWLQIYPIVFNLAVVIVNDVMWVLGLGSSCWMNDILHCFKEKPRAIQALIDVRYDYFGGEHELIVGKNQYRSENSRNKSNLKLRAVFMWKLLNFFVRQTVAFGCCFTYLHVNYYLLQPIQLNLSFVSEIINVLLTCFSWLTILWIYMTFCQVLRWRFQHLNDWIWHFRRNRSLPDMKQFRILTSTYQHYLNTVTIVDDFFKYWIVGIFGVLFFQASLYFQYVINAFENWSPSLQLLIIPLITMPFISALLLLIKRAADVNAESKALDEIMVKLCLHSRANISDNLYKRIKFFMWLVSEGSSLTIFGLVNITKKFMGTAIVFIFSYTLILHEFTPKESICETILRNNLTLGLSQ